MKNPIVFAAVISHGCQFRLVCTLFLLINTSTVLFSSVPFCCYTRIIVNIIIFIVCILFEYNTNIHARTHSQIETHLFTVCWVNADLAQNRIHKTQQRNGYTKHSAHNTGRHWHMHVYIHNKQCGAIVRSLYIFRMASSDNRTNHEQASKLNFTRTNLLTYGLGHNT